MHLTKNIVVTPIFSLVNFFIFLLIPAFVLAQPGTLDRTLNGSGFVRTGYGGGSDSVSASVVQPDGKVVICGNSQDGTDTGFLVIRYNTDGSLDQTFGVGGTVYTRIGSGTAGASGLALQEDGKIVVVGYARVGGKLNFAVVRYETNGSFDALFGSGGTVITRITTGNDTARAVAIQTDGKIVVAGNAFNLDGQSVVIRYLSNGVLESSFNSYGVAWVPTSASSSIAIQSDGKILIGGTYGGGGPHFMIGRFNTDGSYDASFGANGFFVTRIGENSSSGSSLILRPDGKILIAGSSFIKGGYRATLVQVDSNGTLDNSFDQDGRIIIRLPTHDCQLRAAALQSDGKLVLTGRLGSYNSEGYIVAVRINLDGSLDDSFSQNGIKLLTYSGDSYLQGTSIALGPDGSIFVTGNTSSLNRGGILDAGVLKVTSTGNSDGSFGNNGLVIKDVGNASSFLTQSLAIQPDGKIVAVGSSMDGTVSVTRFFNNGSVDEDFGSGGRAKSNEPVANERAYAVAIQQDGRIMAAGQDYNHRFALFRFMESGLPDSTFGVNGKTATSLNLTQSEVTSLAIQSDGKIVAAGVSQGAIAIARYETDGSLDASFGDDGWLRTLIGSEYSVANSVVIQTDGKIVVVGHSGSGGVRDFLTLRYNSDGSLDSSFNGTGFVVTSIGSGNDIAYDLTLQPNGKLVLAGTAQNGSATNFALLRYNSDGMVDNTFGLDGRVITTYGSGENIAHSLAVQGDGRIVVGGTGKGASGQDFITLRYNSDGLLDAGWGNNGVAVADLEGDDFATAMVLDSMERPVLVGKFRGILGIARFLGDFDSSVSISGRVFSSSGRPLSSALVTISNENGWTRSARTNPRGYYTFQSLSVGETFTASVSYKRYQFASRTFTSNSNVTGFNMVAAN